MQLATWLESIFADIRFGTRSFVKTPMIYLAVVVSLAVGIGANTAVFTLLDAAVLKPLPVTDSDRLQVIEWTNDSGFPPYIDSVSGSADTTPDGGMFSASVSVSLYRALAQAQSGFAAIVGISGDTRVSAGVDAASAEPVDLQYVSANFFQDLNVSLPVGRGFLQREDRTAEVPAVVVSHRYWTSRLGGSADALNRSMRINDVDVRIVGVAPPGFFGLSVGQWTDIYAPLAARSLLDRSSIGQNAESPANWWVQQVALLDPDVPPATALARLDDIFRNQVASIAGFEPESSLPSLSAKPGQRGIQAADEGVRTALWLLMLLVGLLLLIVCANVANLLLARSEGRIRESRIRLTLGATPWRIFRQQLVESAMLALVGGVIGLALGFVLATAIHDLFQVGRSASDLFALQLDSRVIAYGTGISMAAALLFGLAPAFRAARAYLRTNLTTQSRSVSVATLRGPRILVSVQLALCLGALVAAGLLGRSLQNLTSVDIGFDAENLVYATVNPRLSDFPADRIEGYLSDVQRELEAIPGIDSVTRLRVRPLEGGGNFSPVNIPGNPRQEGFDPRFLASEYEVGPEVFETLGIPLRAGRSVERGGNGVVVDERFAESFFGGSDVIGRRFGTGAPGNDDVYEIVGVAQNIMSLQLRTEPPPLFYIPFVISESARATSFAIRTSQARGNMLQTIRAVIASVNPSIPLTEIRTQTELLDRMLSTERMLAFLSAGFSLIATSLAAVGLAGLLAYAVARRTGEIGLRMALGAAPGRMIAMVMKDSLKLIAAGLVIGIPFALGVMKLLESSLYELGPADPLTISASILVLLAIALLAALLPARRAAGTAPNAALRNE